MRPSDGRLVQLSHEEYLAASGFSASRAKVLHARSPAHAATYDEATPTIAMDKGSVLHGMLLGSGPEIVIVDAADYKTVAARAARDAAHTAGRVPIKAPDFAELEQAAITAAQRMRDLGIVLDGASEQSIMWSERQERVWVDRTDVVDTACKCRIDHLRIGEIAQIFEIKTCTSAAYQDVERQAESLGYGIAAAAYVRAVEAARPDLVGRVEFYFVFVEIEPPFAVLMCQPDSIFLAIGSARWRRAVAQWQRCQETDTWPAYDGLRTISVPRWVLSRYADGEDV